MTPSSNEIRQETWRQLQWATALIMKRFRADLARQGLSTEEFDVLIHLVASDGGQIPLRELAQRMVLSDTLSRSGLTRLLDRMERDGLVDRQLSRDDRRRFDVSITEQGRRRFEDAWPEHEKGVRSYFSDPLSDTEVADLRRALSKLIRANEDALPEDALPTSATATEPAG